MNSKTYSYLSPIVQYILILLSIFGLIGNWEKVITINRKPVMHTVYNLMKHYDEDKYWKLRSEVVNPKSNLPKIVRLYYLFRIKRMDAFNNASMGTDLGRGAIFEGSPHLVHGLSGIFVSPFARIGKNCNIFHQVTIANDVNGKAPTIGDNCFIGAGAKIIGDIKIGNNVKIGTNAVVVSDIPDNCTVVGVPAEIVKKDGVKIKTISNNSSEQIRILQEQVKDLNDKIENLAKLGAL